MRKGFTLIELMIVIAIIAIIAAIAIPNLLESRVTANEAAAAASLKSAVFASEVQFQGGGYQDQDQNGIGEYGTIGAMAGLIATGSTKTPASTLRLITGPLSKGTTTATMIPSAGYNFMAHAPSTAADNTTPTVTAVMWLEGDAAVAQDTTKPAQVGERYFVAAAAPQQYGTTGRKVFVMGQDGQVRTPTVPAQIQSWWGAAAPTNGTASVLANIKAGIANSYGAAAWAVTILDSGKSAIYPVNSN